MSRPVVPGLAASVSPKSLLERQSEGPAQVSWVRNSGGVWTSSPGDPCWCVWEPCSQWAESQGLLSVHADFFLLTKWEGLHCKSTWPLPPLLFWTSAVSRKRRRLTGNTCDDKWNDRSPGHSGSFTGRCSVPQGPLLDVTSIHDRWWMKGSSFTCPGLPRGVDTISSPPQRHNAHQPQAPSSWPSSHWRF